MNIREYVELTGITAEVIESRGVQTDADGWEHHAFTVRLTNPQTGAMVTPWRQGMGIDKHPAEQVAHIVDSLVSDVWGYQQAGSFEEWADEFGYNTDSRKAEGIYRAIGELEAGVVALLGGRGQFGHVAQEVERL